MYVGERDGVWETMSVLLYKHYRLLSEAVGLHAFSTANQEEPNHRPPLDESLIQFIYPLSLEANRSSIKAHVVLLESY